MVFILGSINRIPGKIRVNAQLINTKTEEAFKSFQLEGTSEAAQQRLRHSQDRHQTSTRLHPLVRSAPTLRPCLEDAARS